MSRQMEKGPYVVLKKYIFVLSGKGNLFEQNATNLFKASLSPRLCRFFFLFVFD